MKRVAFAAFQERGFPMFFIGTATTMMADNTEHVISYWVMFQKFHSPELGGFAVISHWVPFLLFSGYSGALAARYDPRRMIQLGMLLFMSVSICWGVLIATDRLQVWHAAVLLTIHGCAGVLWGPPSQLLIHDMVEGESLPSAVRLAATARYMGALLGPAIGNGLMLLLGPSRGIFANALIYLPMLLWLWRAPYRGQYADGTDRRRAIGGLADAWATLHSIRGNNILFSMTILAGAVSFFIGNSYQAQMPNFAVDLGHGDAGVSYAALTAADAAGALIGAILLESRGLLSPRVSTALVLSMLWCCAMASFALTRSYAVAMSALFCAGFLELSSSAMAQALVQLNAPAALRGQVIGVFAMAASGLRFVSGFTVGILGGLIGVHASLATSAGVLLLCIGALYVWQTHHTRAAAAAT